jgi:6-phosphogluconolactonase
VTRSGPPAPRLRVLRDAEALAAAGAALLAAEVREAARARGRAAIALSGGRVRALLERLASEPLPWQALDVFQVDERVAPRGAPARNLTLLEAALVAPGRLPAGALHALPVDDPDLSRACARYARALEAAAGRPPVLDVVHLGLGADGHTASLFPGDAALAAADADVAPTAGERAGFRRLTLTLPALGRARCAVWVVSGADKAPALARLLAGDAALPAARVAAARRLVLADRAAAAACPAAADSLPC